MAVVRDGGPRLAVDGLDPHFMTQTLQPFSVHLEPMLARQNGLQTPGSETGVDEVDLIKQALDAEVLRALSNRLVIDRRPGHLEEFALFSHAEIRMLFFDQLDTIPHRPSCFDFFRRKSISMACCPILA